MQSTHPGRLIVVEGPDGAGKTDLCAGNPAENFRGMADTLRDRYDLEVLLLREPGGCQLSEHLRAILKGGIVAGALTSHRAEALLFAAARAQLVEEVIRPALQRGAWVLLDRWLHSSLVYQGLARGLPVDEVKQLSIFACDNLRADRVIALQVSQQTADARRRARDGDTGDRIEQSTSAQVIRDGYANLKQLDAHEVVEVSADGDRHQTLALCLDAIADLLPDAPPLSAEQAADKALARWMAEHPGARGFHARAVIRHSGLPRDHIQAALQRAVDSGRLTRSVRVLCPESGATFGVYDAHDVPVGREVECDDCLGAHLVEERDLWVCYTDSALTGR